MPEFQIIAREVNEIDYRVEAGTAEEVLQRFMEDRDSPDIVELNETTLGITGVRVYVSDGKGDFEENPAVSRGGCAACQIPYQDC